MYLSIPCAVCGEPVEIGFPLALTDKRAFIEQIVATEGVTCDVEAGDVVVRHTACKSTPEHRWQPIDTAPKDGTMVLLWLGNRELGVVNGYWIGGTLPGDDPGWYTEPGPKPLAMWKLEPTHWMPMLPGPEEAP